MPEDSHDVPLCVDLDDSLIRTDLLFEAFAKAVLKKPLLILQFIFDLIKKNKAWAKCNLAANIDLDYASLPYNHDLARFLEDQSRFREIYLVTASPQVWGRAIAQRFGFFNAVYGSRPDCNLKGTAKEQLLLSKFGERGFDYVGDSWADLKVWRSARSAYLVGNSRRLEMAIAGVGSLKGKFESEKFDPMTMVRMLRVHQWIKNVLIFVPMVAAHEIFSLGTLFKGFLAFLCFSNIASAVYILNDLCDLESDRAHRTKRNRPLAAGEVKLRQALLMAPMLLFFGFGVALTLSTQFLTVLLGYFLLTTMYSLSLKRMAMVDVVVLASLYTLRMVAGAIATAIPLTMWLFSFSMFFFFSLACAKRFGELCSIDVAEQRVPGRGYFYGDRDLIGIFGVSSAITSILVLALYVTAQEVVTLYSFPQILLLLCPLVLLWMSRVWLSAYRGELDDDPIVYALKYRGSYVIGLAALFVLILASYL